METETLVESEARTLRLSEAQLNQLAAVGRRLASGSIWWGEPEDEEDPSTAPRSVIGIERLSGSRAKITVRDAIGAISIGGLQLSVMPKIRPEHFWYLAERSEIVPRLDEQRAALNLGTDLWELMSQWFLSRLEAVLRGDLVRDYRSHRAEQTFLTGRVVPLPTTRAYYSGRPSLTCDFELFDADTPVNRVLLAATRSILANSRSSVGVRKRARRLSLGMGEVSELRAGDLAVRPDSRMTRYFDAHLLARQILTSQLRELGSGDATSSWAFLIRTPSLVEAGVRNLLTDRLAPLIRVGNTGKLISGTKLRLQPDLVFNDTLAVGDIKYKLTDAGWRRNDLYQVTSFATAYQTDRGAVISFDDSEDPAPLPDLRLGDVTLRSLTWRCSLQVSPEDAAEALVGDCSNWLLGKPDEDRSYAPTRDAVAS